MSSAVMMATMNQSSPALTASMDVPRTQNTAPVLEFRCMYTSDIRRKQKRWQDGRLRFHTFNKRVMVYDDRSNFVGDTHWRKDYDFDDGEELDLERGGIMVEVGECIGKRDQDLTQLVDKRIKDREERAAAKNTSSSMRTHAPLDGPQTPAGSAFLRPKSLNAVLGNPTGHYGKAVIPNLSPFEQRQEANRADNDGPAKRRKLDEAPPSRNGYAQSLMGTKLTLALSKPPSTATIRYEPLRFSIQRTPATTIDLTSDEENRRTEMAWRATARNERTAPKHQQQKRNNSPPARSGYASSLTGASLSLNQPESYSSKRSVDGYALSTRASKPGLVEGNGSSSVKRDSLLEYESLKNRPATRIQKQRGPTKKTTESSTLYPIVSSGSSSPPVVIRHPVLSESSKTVKNKVTQDSLASRLIADQPVSTLRIKSRAPRKMMMLMQCPISRSSVRTESSDESQATSTGRQNPKSSSQNVVPSQATMRLDVFRERQEQCLQERLNGIRPDSCAEHLPSSLTDSGLSYHMIDSLLCRKMKPSERGKSVIAAGTAQIKPAVDTRRVKYKERATHNLKAKHMKDSTEAVMNSPAMVPSGSMSNSEFNNKVASQEPCVPNLPAVSTALQQAAVLSTDVTTELIAPPRETSNLGNRISITDAMIDKTVSHSETILTVNPRKTILQRTKPGDLKSNSIQESSSSHGEELSHIQKTPSGATNPPYGTQGRLPQLHSPTSNGIVPTVDEERIPAHPSSAGMDENEGKLTQVPHVESGVPHNSTAIRSKTTPPPSHFSNAVTSASDRFRAIIKTSASSSNQVAQESSHFEQPDLTFAEDITQQNLVPVLCEVAIKASQKPSSPFRETFDNEAQPSGIVASATGIDSVFDRTVPTATNVIAGQSKVMLVNPATRGLSVQMTANMTVNTLVPAFNRLTSMARSTGGLAKELAMGGPWSRESFDLFGLWRPPGRDADTNTLPKASC